MTGNPPQRKLVIITLGLGLGILAATPQIGPFLEYRARVHRDDFCALILAGKVGEASQLMPENDRTGFIRGSKELPSSCAVQRDPGAGEGTRRAYELVLRYPDGHAKKFHFVYEEAGFMAWKYPRLVAVESDPLG